MATSLSLIVGLLTTALSLLTLVQQNPNLPQASLDNARQMAESVIAQATSMLTASSSNIAVTTAEAIPTSNSTSSGIGLKLGKITTTPNSAQISWTTNVPTASKITVTKTPVESNASTAQYLPSANGISTKGLASVVGLEQNTEYAYIIEAGTDDSIELNGKFITAKSDEQIAKELEEARVQKMMDAIKRDGYYISCNDDRSFCTKTTDGFCWSESLNGRPFTGRSCGG